jgi:hypothetical protein
MKIRMRMLISVAVLLVLVAWPLPAKAPVPRKSPELKFTNPAGKEILLSSFNGKVIVIEFLLVRCPHCLRVVQMINSLQGELGSREFQPVIIAFDNKITGQVMTSFVDHFKLNCPVGYTSSDKVDAYLGRSAMERLQVPQIVVIDRTGIVRAQSGANGDPNLESLQSLKNLVDSLLK